MFTAGSNLVVLRHVRKEFMFLGQDPFHYVILFESGASVMDQDSVACSSAQNQNKEGPCVQDLHLVLSPT